MRRPWTRPSSRTSEHIREHYETVLDTLERNHAVTPEAGRWRAGMLPNGSGRYRWPISSTPSRWASTCSWTPSASLAVDDASRQAALSSISLIPRYFDVVIAHAADVYLEAEQLLASTGERLRRDLLEDLLAGSPPPPGPMLECGVCGRARSAKPVPGDRGRTDRCRRGSARAPGRGHRAGSGHPAGRAASDRGPPRGDRNRSRRRRRPGTRSGLPPASQRLSGAWPATFRLPWASARCMRAWPRAWPPPTARPRRPGVYLCADLWVSRAPRHVGVRIPDGTQGDSTARRTAPPAVGRFLSEDQADGGVLIETLQAYAKADFERQAGGRRTAHARQHGSLPPGPDFRAVGCRDLRRVSDLSELLIAARLVDRRAPAS